MPRFGIRQRCFYRQPLCRKAMGRHIIEKTGNIAVVQKQLGHKNAAYSM